MSFKVGCFLLLLFLYCLFKGLLSGSDLELPFKRLKCLNLRNSLRELSLKQLSMMPNLKKLLLNYSFERSEMFETLAKLVYLFDSSHQVILSFL